VLTVVQYTFTAFMPRIGIRSLPVKNTVHKQKDKSGTRCNVDQ